MTAANLIQIDVGVASPLEKYIRRLLHVPIISLELNLTFQLFRKNVSI